MLDICEAGSAQQKTTTGETLIDSEILDENTGGVDVLSTLMQ